MKITALTENTTKIPGLATVHGLSVHIETPKHKMLFDLGPDETFSKNAEALGIDLAEVDIVVISHGHYDHCGALGEFLEINDKAKVYIRRQAFDPHFADTGSSRKFNGLDADLAGNERLVFTDERSRIDDELFVFSGVSDILETNSRRVLFKQAPEGYVQDDFDHEQSLIVTADNKTVLFSGCSHAGIDSIMSAACRYQPGIEAVFGGFHMSNPDSGATEPEELMQGLAERLAAHEAVFHTCHCTGEKAYAFMLRTMGEKLKYFSAGTVVEL